MKGNHEAGIMQRGSCNEFRLIRHKAAAFIETLHGKGLGTRREL